MLPALLPYRYHAAAMLLHFCWAPMYRGQSGIWPLEPPDDVAVRQITSSGDRNEGGGGGTLDATCLWQCEWRRPHCVAMPAGRPPHPAEDISHRVPSTPEPIALAVVRVATSHPLASDPPRGVAPTHGNGGWVFVRRTGQMARPRGHQLAARLPQGGEARRTSTSLRSSMGGCWSALMSRSFARCRVGDHCAKPTTLQCGALPPDIGGQLPPSCSVQESGPCSGGLVPQPYGEGGPATCQPLPAVETNPSGCPFPRPHCSHAIVAAAAMPLSLLLLPCHCRCHISAMSLPCRRLDAAISMPCRSPCQCHTAAVSLPSRCVVSAVMSLPPRCDVAALVAAPSDGASARSALRPDQGASGGPIAPASGHPRNHTIVGSMCLQRRSA